MSGCGDPIIIKGYRSECGFAHATSRKGTDLHTTHHVRTGTRYIVFVWSREDSGDTGETVRAVNISAFNIIDLDEAVAMWEDVFEVPTQEEVDNAKSSLVGVYESLSK